MGDFEEMCWRLGIRNPLEVNCNPDRGFADGTGVDGAGNIYAAFTLNHSTVFLRKYTPQGTLLWERQISDVTRTNSFQELQVTENGQVYVATTEIVRDQSGGQIATRAVVRAFDAQGNPLWVRPFQGYLQTPEQNPRTYPVETVHSGGLAVGPDGFVYVAGTAKGNLFRQLYGPAWNADGPTSAWVAKLNPGDGSVVWGDQFVGEPQPGFGGADWPYALAVAPDGSEVYMGGTSSLNHPPYTNRGSNDALFARYDAASGARLEVRLYGGAGYNALKSIAFTPDGSHVYLGLGGQIPALYKLPRTYLDLDSALWVLDMGYPGGPQAILPQGNLLYVQNAGGMSGYQGLLRVLP